MIEFFEKGFTERQIMEDFSLITISRWAAYRTEHNKAQIKANKRGSGRSGSSVSHRNKDGSITVPVKRAF